MSRTGRVRGSTSISSVIICIYLYLSTVVSSDYGIPIEIKIWNDERMPISHMVDVTNGFGLKVLAEHNFLNDNNIAFSPYGLMGILVALYEGVDGDSSYQMQRAIQLPWHRNIMRIGFRDIHRTLKTYFVPEEGFLAGLALNNENVTFNESYKRVLRFYGFDLENDQLPTFPAQDNTSTTESTTIKSPTVDNIVSASADKTSTSSPLEMKPLQETMITESTTVKSSTINNETSPPTVKEDTSSTISIPAEDKPQEEITPTIPKQEITTMSNVQINDADDDIPVSTTSSTTSATESTTAASIIEQSTTTELTAVENETMTQLVSNSATVSLTTEEPNVTSTTDILITTTNTVTLNSETDAETISQQTSQATVALTADAMINQVINTTNADLVLSTEQITSTDTTTVVSTTANTESTQAIDESTPSLETQNTDQTVSTSTTLDSTTLMTTSPMIETLQRRKKSLVDFIYTNPPYMDEYLLYRSFDIPLTIPEENFDNPFFLANGLKSIQVTYMHYDTVLEHAYLPHLEASAVRLPLDSERYYLLVVLPDRGSTAELGRLLARMARESDLSDIYAALRPRRVKGIVPSFTVKGHVTLTTDLQKLGIRDVFEPRQRDFSSMTKQSGVYVRSIEQAVSVAIRKYKPDDHKKNRYVTNRTPVKFYATYPFLYFVMDASIHVSLMAGKMVDPLNSRIL